MPTCTPPQFESGFAASSAATFSFDSSPAAGAVSRSFPRSRRVNGIVPEAYHRAGEPRAPSATPSRAGGCMRTIVALGLLVLAASDARAQGRSEGVTFGVTAGAGIPAAD